MGHETPNLLANRCIIIGNHLQLIKRIGTGGYGAVYLVADLKSGQQYAVKIVLQENATQVSTKPKSKESTAHEIEKQLLASATHTRLSGSGVSSASSLFSNAYNGEDITYHIPVQTLSLHGISRYSGPSPILKEVSLQLKVHAHPNVLTIHHVYESRFNVFIVMDYYPEGDLFAAIVDNQRYVNDSSLVKSVFKQLCDALIFCHLQSIYHCDVKPENILISGRGERVVLADFGLAISTAFVDSSICCGSSYYMAPERVMHGLSASSSALVSRSSSVTSLDDYHRSPQRYPTALGDIWSLTVILVNLTCIRNPWLQAHSLHDETFKAFLANPMEVLRNILPISVEFALLLIRLFQLDPFKRIPLKVLQKEVLDLRSMHELGPMSLCLPYYDVEDWNIQPYPSDPSESLFASSLCSSVNPFDALKPGKSHSLEAVEEECEPSERSKLPIIDLNCGALSPSTIATSPSFSAGHSSVLNFSRQKAYIKPQSQLSNLYTTDEDDSLWTMDDYNSGASQQSIKSDLVPHSDVAHPYYQQQTSCNKFYGTNGYDYYNSKATLRDAYSYQPQGHINTQGRIFQNISSMVNDTEEDNYKFCLSGFR
ncbi:hypothetical protein BABINDRAFT_164100 [Babjeviella inositovora NRRL Y-12698]|uniref:non-specific serine/threonine protein kinase n=1 Tax=Babjeviella inositovora NRRL Y-12698 TaxID=984486 RepID=A0A1E3QX68_9ASCO|nr:uncharacterized protein BABINDRAFT_164100 [Babjeviella inositovora NRRL Y-12698]ODQ82289.1 hypothetical protein BABINDRAFT_164100 [Babjeviella inositovora NRRL Y-12698]